MKLPCYLILNVLHITEYHDYVHGIRNGLKAVERQFSLNNVLKLRGPAGLFKDLKKHPLCWGVLENCNKNLSLCPIDVITFHRKGNGNDADEILNGSLDLLKRFSQKFPSLALLKYSNSEADPIKQWSKPRDFQADTRYASALIDTVFGHWQAMYDGRMKNLDSISHDNSFLNYNPNFFTQRTLLARFQMNKTTPQHVQFVQKPVFSALGLVSNLATFAGKVNLVMENNLSYVITTNNHLKRFFSCIIIWNHENLKTFTNKSKSYEIIVQNLPQNTSTEGLFYFVEGLDNERTNPAAVYQKLKSPSFPDINEFMQMRNVHNPLVLSQPAKVTNGKIILNLKLMPPFMIAIRICNKKISKPKRVNNLRLRKVNSEEIIIFWSDQFYRARYVVESRVACVFSSLIKDLI